MADNNICHETQGADQTMALHVEINELQAPTNAAVALIGELDEAGGKIARRQLARAVQSGKVNLTIDLDRVDTLDSSGLAALIATLRLARDRGGDVRVRATKPDIRRVMELTGLSRVFRLTAPLEAGAASAA